MVDGDAEMIAPWGLRWSQHVRRAQLERARQVLRYRRQMLDQKSKLIDSYYKAISDRITTLGTQPTGYGVETEQDVLTED
jgi:hypothetical protein